MIVQCPSCGKQLKMGAKVQETLQQLEAGRRLKVKCVHCGNPFDVDASMDQEKSVAPPAAPARRQAPAASQVRPPGPPDLTWLKEGTFEDKETIEDVPRALVLMPPGEPLKVVLKAAEDFGYQVEQALTPEEAISKMRFVNYAAVFLHSHFEETSLDASSFHLHMRDMSMARRRYVLYILVGPEFSSLYDLQAMSCSANVVVNEAEIGYIGTILKKVIPEYELLFGPFMEELRMAGK